MRFGGLAQLDFTGLYDSKRIPETDVVDIAINEINKWIDEMLRKSRDKYNGTN